MAPIPENPALHPWTSVVRISDEHLRIVTTDRQIVDLSESDSAAVTAVCELLERNWPTRRIRQQSPARHGLRVLADLNQLISSHLPGPGAPHGPAAPEPLPPVVAVLGPSDWRSAIRAALGSAGIDAPVRLPPVRSGSPYLDHPSNPDRSSSAYHPSDLDHLLDGVNLVVMVGELDWPLVSALSTTGQAHLLLTPSATSVALGPVVVPGSTPCLRCVHLARCDADPWWPATAEALRDRPLPASDPVLMASAAISAAALAAAWLVHGDLTPVGLQTTAPLGETRSHRVQWHSLCDCRSPRLVATPGIPTSQVTGRHPKCHASTSPRDY